MRKTNSRKRNEKKDHFEEVETYTFKEKRKRERERERNKKREGHHYEAQTTENRDKK